MMSQSLITLVSKTVSGDRDAFEKLLISQNGLILWIIRGMTDCPHDAEDIRQEVSIRMFRYIAKLKRPEAFGSWLRTLVVRECRRHYASLKSRIPTDTLPEPETLPAETDPDILPFAHMERLELKSALESALKGLREPARKMFHMRYEKNMSCSDIAAATGVKTGTVSVTLFRVRVRLLEILDGGCVNG